MYKMPKVVELLLLTVVLLPLTSAEDVMLKCDEVERMYDSAAGEPFCTVSGFVVSHSQNVKIQRNSKANMTKFMKFYDSRLLYVPFQLFDVFVNLKTLDVSFTQILDVTRNTFGTASNLTYLNMSNNNITQLTTSVFVGAHSLMRLDLSRNHITDMNEMAFRGLASLDKLQLSYNQLKHIHKEIFVENPYVETVALDNNLIEYIEPEVFNQLRRIRDVNLSHNLIHTIHPGTFEAAYSLETLILNANQLNEFELANKSILTQLQLDDNNLTSIFINGTKLVRANNNHITQVHMINPAFLESLELNANNVTDINSIVALAGLLQLDLSYNPIGPLNVTTFDRMKRLRILHLRHTGVTQLTFGMFSKQANLEVLDLSYNNLTALNLDIFVPYLTNLKQFYVDANNLTEIQGKRAFSQAFPNLQTLGVSRNGFNCTYLHTLLIPPNLYPTVALHIEPEDSSVEVSHIRDVSCVSDTKQTLQHAQLELSNISELQRYLNISMQQLYLHERRLEIYLLSLKIVLLILVCLLPLAVGAALYWRRQRSRKSYFSRRSGGSIVFHSDATVNASMDH